MMSYLAVNYVGSADDNFTKRKSLSTYVAIFHRGYAPRTCVQCALTHSYS